MDPRENPYTPNAGARPPLLVGRDEELAGFDLLLARVSRGHTEQSMVITGLRGVGKTVLLGEFRTATEAAGWVAVEAEITRQTSSVSASRFWRAGLSCRSRPALAGNSVRAAPPGCSSRSR